jgi:hypothetical protein
VPATSIGRKLTDAFRQVASRLVQRRGASAGETPPAAAAEPPIAQEAQDALGQAIAHLEYLGYEVEPPEPDGWRLARHPLRYDFHLRAFPWGIRFFCAVATGLAVGKGRSEWLEYLNTGNQRSRVTHFSLVEDAWGMYGVRMLAFASLPYSRAGFAVLMDMWHDDLDWIRRKREFAARTPVVEDAGEQEAVTLH